jgi:hypothetical protein
VNPLTFLANLLSLRYATISMRFTWSLPPPSLPISWFVSSISTLALLLSLPVGVCPETYRSQTLTSPWRTPRVCRTHSAWTGLSLLRNRWRYCCSCDAAFESWYEVSVVEWIPKSVSMRLWASSMTTI